VVKVVKQGAKGKGQKAKNQSTPFVSSLCGEKTCHLHFDK
jgi:hypothetical protein